MPCPPSTRSVWPTGRATVPGSCPGANSSASRSPAPSPALLPYCWPTNPPEHSTSTPAHESWSSCINSNGKEPTLLVPVTGQAGADRQETTRHWQRLLTRLASDGSTTVSAFIQDGKARVHVGGEQVGELALLDVDSSLRTIRPFPVVKGQWFTTATVGPQLVVNEAAWQQAAWRDGRVELLREGSYDRQPARLLGVVDDGSSEPQGYVSLNGGDAWTDTAYDSGSVSLLVHSERLDSTTLRQRITDAAARSGREGELGDVRRIDTVDDFTTTLDTSRRIFLGIAVLSLLVGSLGILNIGLATLRERAEELSLRRSFGATRSHVVQIMILESQFVAVGAAAMAIVLAAIGAPLVFPRLTAQVPLDSTTLPVSAMAVGLGISCLAALLGALAPALRAARVPISSIMR